MQDVGPGAGASYQPLIGDRYRILKKIGEGGMGEVYLAEHIYIEKRVAIKLLRPEVLSNQEAVIRFRQEARSASSIGHDNIIQIDDFGTMPDGRIYMAMEFLQGEPLNELLAKGPLALPRALDILIQVTRALAAAHAKGITHRDMKPENIFITQRAHDGRDLPKLLDFGIAKVSGADTGQNLTIAGAIFGTPFYMAPEQAMGGKMDHRVDIYAMGVILYEIFVGQVPFQAETFMGILTQHITTEAVPASQAAARNGRIVPRELEAIIQKAMRKNVADRYQSMNELSGALMDFYRYAVGSPISGYQAVVAPPIASRKRWPIVVGSTMAAAVVALVGWQIGNSNNVIAGMPDAAPVPDAAVLVPTIPDGGPGSRIPPVLDAAAPVPPRPPDATPVSVDPPPDIVAPRMRSVMIRTEPDGATVYLGRRRLGKTPLRVELPVAATRSYTLERSGYVSATVRVVPGGGAVIVRELESELKRPE